MMRGGIDDLVPDARGWVETGPVYTGHLDFDSVLGRVLKPSLVSDYPGWMEWLERREAWVRSGTADTDMPRVTFTLDGKSVSKRVRRDKHGSAVLYTSSELDQLAREGSTVYRSIVKRETGKKRLVISDSLSNYLPQAYAAGWLEACASSVFTPLLNKDWLGDVISEVSNRWNVAAKVHSPLDQSEFDKHKGRDKILELTLALGRWMERNGAPPDVMEAWKLVIRQMSAKSEVLVGESRLQWQKGLLSGWRLTALYGTLLNASETLEALDHESEGERWTAVFQGDDVRLVTSYVDTAVRVAGRITSWVTTST